MEARHEEEREDRRPKADDRVRLDPYAGLPEYEEILKGHPQLITLARTFQTLHDRENGSAPGPSLRKEAAPLRAALLAAIHEVEKLVELHYRFGQAVRRAMELAQKSQESGLTEKEIAEYDILEETLQKQPSGFLGPILT